MFDLTYRSYGSQALLIEWPKEISESVLFDLLIFKQFLIGYYDKQFVEINHAYCSILISYRKDHVNINSQIDKLKAQYKNSTSRNSIERTVYEIPVCYDRSFGCDLETLSSQLGLTTADLIERHCKPIYTVYFIGFLPGFLYLGGLDKTIHFPRREAPRLQVPKGAVAIGGAQTGIYPVESPGGWNIIGNTPIELFNPEIEIPCPITAGDQVKFVAVSLDSYRDIERAMTKGSYHLNTITNND